MKQTRLAGPVALVGVAGMLCVCSAAYAQNDCADAAPIAGFGDFAFDTGAATRDGRGDLACNSPLGHQINNDIWFCWQAPCSGVVALSTCGQTSVDTKVAVYDGCACPEGLGILDCNDDTCGLQSRIEWSAVGGASYLIRMGTPPLADGGVGSFTIALEGVPGDTCAGAIDIAGDGTFAFDNSCAGSEGQALPACGFGGSAQIDRDVWFRWAPAAGGDVTIGTCGSGVDTRIAVFDGGVCPAGSGVIACSDNACGQQSRVQFLATSGNEYLIRVGSAPGQPGGFGSLSIETAPPANDDCSGAIDVNDGAVETGNLTFATRNGSADASASCGSSEIPGDAWYRFQAPECGGVLQISTCGTNDAPGIDLGPDTTLSVHSGCPGTIDNELDCNDDAPFGSGAVLCVVGDEGEPQDAAISLRMSGLQEVYIRVSYVFGSLRGGDYLLNVKFEAEPQNFGFETGDFTCWTPENLNGPSTPLHVGGAGESNGFFATSPSEGVFSAIHSWDGGAGAVSLTKLVSVPGGDPVAVFDHRAAWDLSGVTLDRALELHVLSWPDGAPLGDFTLLTAEAGTTVFDTGVEQLSADLSDWKNQVVQLSFRWTVPQANAGPGWVQFDSLSFEATVPAAQGNGPMCDRNLDNRVGADDFFLFVSEFIAGGPGGDTGEFFDFLVCYTTPGPTLLGG